MSNSSTYFLLSVKDRKPSIIGVSTDYMELVKRSLALQTHPSKPSDPRYAVRPANEKMGMVEQAKKTFLTDNEVAVIIDSLAAMREQLRLFSETPNLDTALAKIGRLVDPSTRGIRIDGVR